jgi:hypothetical protein
VTFFNQVAGKTGSPSPWRAGVEARFKLLYARVEGSWARMDADAASYGVEVGVGI